MKNALHIIKLEPLKKKPLYAQINTLLRGFDIDHYPSEDLRRNGDTTLYKPLNILFLNPSAEEEKAFSMHQRINEKGEEEIKRNRYNHIKVPFIDFHNSARWRAGLKHIESDFSLSVQMCEESYFHFLECVPPKTFSNTSYVCGEPYTHNSNGQEVYLCGIEIDGKYYAQYGTLANFRNNQLFKNI